MARYNDNIKVILQNVLKWTYTRRNEISNYYQKESPDIILLNSTGCRDNEPIKLFNYNVHQRNTRGEDHAGIAIAIKRNINYQLIDDFDSDILAIKLETSKGPVIFATTYLPPRRHHIPEAEFRNLLQKPMPVYLFADLNARHRIIGHQQSNTAGNVVADLIRRNVCQRKHIPDSDLKVLYCIVLY